MGRTRRTTGDGGKGRTSTSRRTSTNSGGHSKDSKERWHTPATVRQFAAQCNKIATMILNDEIDMEIARAYAGLARVVTQAASIEVAKSRFMKLEPDLSLNELATELDDL